MRKLAPVLAIAFALLGPVAAAPAEGGGERRFVAYDVRIDAGDAPLAAWQVEVTYDPAVTKVLSLEGGETEGFCDAPHYDRRGMTGGRIVIAAFVLADAAAPRGATRVARLHLLTEGAAEAPAVRLVTAARPGGTKIGGTVTLAPSTTDEEGK